MTQNKAAPALKAGIITIALAGVLVVIKAAVFALSGSLAVLSSLIDSLIDVSVSAVNYGAIRYSAKPPDKEHRYGHGKIEGLAALLQAGVLCGAALFLVFEALMRFLNPEPISHHILIIVVMMISVVIALGIVAIQNRAKEKTGSLASESEGAHYTADIVLHGGVVVTVLAQYYNGPSWIDAAFALLVAGWLVFTARDIGGKGMDMILDRELPDEQRKEILKVIKAQEGVLGVHDLRTTKSGMKEIIDFDIEAEATLSLHDAHEITKRVENAILKLYPEAEIMIHVDPHGDTDDSRHKVSGVHH